MLSVSSLNQSFGAQVLFDDVSFNINTRERIGLVGRNGSGKTTLFNFLCHTASPDSGNISIPKNYSIGYVKQHLKFTKDTVLNEGCLGLPKGDEDSIWKVEKILFGLGFSQIELDKNPSLLSGGYQVRLNLAKVLISEPHLLLLDEPTNYLDIVSIRWLERFLRMWPNELVLITHDRTFMDTVTTHTMIIHRQRIKKIAGTTDKLYEQLATEEETYEKTRVKDDKRRKEMEDFVRRFRSKARLASMAQSRVKSLARNTEMTKLEKIESLEFSFNEADFPAKTIMDTHQISFAYENSDLLIKDFSMTIGRSDRICIMGKNGKGKTTLLKLFSGEIKPLEGDVNHHPRVEIGVFGQTNIDRLSPEHTIESELLSASDESNPKIIRSICGSMMFSGDLAKKNIKVLSGGEKSRVLLGKLLLQKSNLLFLDEPTNHLDMESCDSLIEAIDVFSGAVIMVTHNELFLKSIANRLIVFDNDNVSVFEGTYKEFIKKIGWQGENTPKKKAKEGYKQDNSIKADDGKLQKQKTTNNKARKVELRPIENMIKKIEKRIELLESEIDENNERIAKASIEQNSKLIADLSKENHEFQRKIDQQYEILEAEMDKHSVVEKKYS